MKNLLKNLNNALNETRDRYTIDEKAICSLSVAWRFHI